MAKFKVGDRVRVRVGEALPPYFYDGDEGVVVEVDESDVPYLVAKSNSEATFWAEEDALEKIEE